MTPIPRRAWAGVAVLALTAVACSGSLPDWYYGKGAGPEITLVEEPAEPSDGSTPPAQPTGVTSVLPTAISTGGATAPPPTGTQPTIGPPTTPPKRYVANIYSGAADTIGLTDDRIYLCGHAALIYGSVFNITKEDLNVYWQMVNDTPGKVHGRRVDLNWKDDRYEGTEASAKVKECIAENPFFILGGIGFDQIPFARAEAEKGRTLYLHHMAIAKGLDRAVHSFSMQPTVEEVGHAFGEHIRSKYRGKKVGIVYRKSDYFTPGHDAGVAAMKGYVTIEKDLDADKNQHVYREEIAALIDADVDVVWIWESALAAAEIIQQAAAQDFHPKWVVFPFQLILDTIGKENSLNPSIDGVATWPAYKPGGYGNEFSQFEYTAEIRRFEAAMRRYRPNTAPNDILWMTWLGNKSIHGLLDACGRDCTRNKIAGAFLGGLKARVDPNCEANFAHPASLRGRVGLHRFTVLETIDNGDRAAFKTVAWCRERLG